MQLNLYIVSRYIYAGLSHIGNDEDKFSNNKSMSSHLPTSICPLISERQYLDSPLGCSEIGADKCGRTDRKRQIIKPWGFQYSDAICPLVKQMKTLHTGGNV